MNIEEKNLLLKDLCARFIYGVIVRVYDIEHGDFDSYVDNISNTCIETHPVEELTIDFNPYVFYKLQEIKPYLRPMSSITKEEISDLQKINSQFCFDTFDNFAYVGAADDGFCSVEEMDKILDYLNSKHFDYRGLIEKGLAIEAPKDMYN